MKICQFAAKSWSIFMKADVNSKKSRTMQIGYFCSMLVTQQQISKKGLALQITGTKMVTARQQKS